MNWTLKCGICLHLLVLMGLIYSITRIRLIRGGPRTLVSDNFVFQGNNTGLYDGHQVSECVPSLDMLAQVYDSRIYGMFVLLWFSLYMNCCGIHPNLLAMVFVKEYNKTEPYHRVMGWMIRDISIGLVVFILVIIACMGLLKIDMLSHYQTTSCLDESNKIHPNIYIEWPDYIMEGHLRMNDFIGMNMKIQFILACCTCLYWAEEKKAKAEVQTVEEKV